MTRASHDAYASILPQLAKREQDVLQTLLTFREAPGCGPGSVRRGPCGMTNREIGRILGLDRDSISPRTARLRQKGLVVEAGISGSETLYEAAIDPQFVKAPGKRKPKAYYDGIRDARDIVQALINRQPSDLSHEQMLTLAHLKITELLK